MNLGTLRELVDDRNHVRFLSTMCGVYTPTPMRRLLPRLDGPARAGAIVLAMAVPLVLVSLVAPLAPAVVAGEGDPAAAPSGSEGIFKLDHLIFIVQENRSFDHYFGTYPGADGIDFRNGKPANCVPDPILDRMSCGYHSTRDRYVG
ncbi:MAG: alkaline phosphatase family protein, partial [Actinomycetota bacterium]